MKKSSNTFDRTFKITLMCFCISIGFILFLPYLLTKGAYYVDLNFTDTGAIGDTLGGIMRPFIAIVGAGLTFLAFWVQYKANEQQKRDLQIERFENKLYNMLEVQREYVLAISLDESIRGRDSFILMYSELKYLYEKVIYHLEDAKQNDLVKELSKEKEVKDTFIFNVVYLIFFYGFGQESKKMIYELVDEKHHDLLESIETHILFLQSSKAFQKELDFVEQKYKGEDFSSLSPQYIPFKGNMSTLSNYFRHLFLIVRFIDEQPDDVIGYKEKYGYASMLRAQLSIHEQLLIYYNALSILGKPWLDTDKNFLEKYCLIRSIPLPLADFHIKPEVKFPNDKNAYDKYIFEWKETELEMKNNNKISG